jgi:hypothetical protein
LRREDALTVARPAGLSSGWTVRHKSGLEVIPPVRYRSDAETARTELLDTPVDWARQDAGEGAGYADVYLRYVELRLRQLTESEYWGPSDHPSPDSPGPGFCPCGRPLVQPLLFGRKRLYCSEACSQRAYRARHKQS